MPRINRSAPHKPFRPHVPCERKRRFKTETEAQDAIEHASLMDIRLELKTYQCPYCNGWHLSSVK